MKFSLFMMRHRKSMLKFLAFDIAIKFNISVFFMDA